MLTYFCINVFVFYNRVTITQAGLYAYSEDNGTTLILSWWLTVSGENDVFLEGSTYKLFNRQLE